MNRIKLSNGLIAIGGALKIGKTNFSLKLANHLALTEKILFLSWQDCKDNLEATIVRMGDTINENLDINTSLDNLNVGSFLELISIIEDNKYTSIFIDDIENFTQYNFKDMFSEQKDSSIKAMKYIVNTLNVRIILNTTILYDRWEPTLRLFDWSRSIINDCNQILAIYRPAYFGITQDDEGNSLLDKIEILNLKNDNCLKETIELSNKTLNIFNNGIH